MIRTSITSLICNYSQTSRSKLQSLSTSSYTVFSIQFHYTDEQTCQSNRSALLIYILSFISDGTKLLTLSQPQTPNISARFTPRPHRQRHISRSSQLLTSARIFSRRQALSLHLFFVFEIQSRDTLPVPRRQGGIIDVKGMRGTNLLQSNTRLG